jgi:hypothetical protein
MEIQKSYIVDETGDIKKVILDYESFKKIEELILDLGLAKAMEEALDDEEVDLEQAKILMNFQDES